MNWNPFNLSGIEAAVVSIAIASAVVLCWRMTCDTTVTVTSLVCEAVKFAWNTLERIADKR